MTILRSKKLWLLGLCSLVVALAGIRGCLTRSPEDRFASRHGELTEVVEQWQESSGGSRLRGLELRSSSGLQVELTLRWPADSHGERLPLVVILGGHGTGRRAVELVADPGQVALAALDYPYRGDHRLRGLAVATAVPKIRRALLDTPPAIWLALDHLQGLPFVDPDRVELVGVSLGAPLATVAGALDPRFARVWSIHGGGRPDLMLDANLSDELPAWLLPPVTALGGLLVAQLTPERFVHRLAPRPLILVNAEDDTQIPRACVESLYQAAREPKELIWLPGGHIRPDAEAQLRQIVQLVLQRVHGRSSTDFG